MDHDYRDLERKIDNLESDLEYEIRRKVEEVENRLEMHIDRLANIIQHLQTRIEELETLPRD